MKTMEKWSISHGLCWFDWISSHRVERLEIERDCCGEQKRRKASGKRDFVKVRPGLSHHVSACHYWHVVPQNTQASSYRNAQLVAILVEFFTNSAQEECQYCQLRFEQVCIPVGCWPWACWPSVFGWGVHSLVVECILCASPTREQNDTRLWNITFPILRIYGRKTRNNLCISYSGKT